MTKRDSSSHADQHADMCVTAWIEQSLASAPGRGHAALSPCESSDHRCSRMVANSPARAHGVGLARAGKIDADFLQDASRPRAHHQNAVGKEDRLVHVVGDEHDGLGRLRQNDGDLALKLLARDGIERAERLIEQQHVGVEGERAREADALLHAAGQLVRIVLANPSSPTRRTKRSRRAPAHLRGGELRHFEAEGDVARDGQPRKQVELLKHHRARRRRCFHALARYRNYAARGRLEPVQDAQQRGLAAAARAR